MSIPPNELEEWITQEVIAADSPFLEAAEAGLATTHPVGTSTISRAILAAIAAGNTTYADISRAAGIATTALGRPLSNLERAGMFTRIPDPLCTKGDLYTLADPHLHPRLSNRYHP